jgi:hypothetical protein
MAGAEREQAAEPSGESARSVTGAPSAGPASEPLSPQGLLALQRSAGNRAVGRLLQRAGTGSGSPPPPPPPPSIKRTDYYEHATLIGYEGTAPVWAVPEADMPRAEPRFVAPLPDPELPWRTDMIVDKPSGPEIVTMANVGTYIHDNFELIDHLLLEDAESLTTERLPPGLEKEFRIKNPNQPPARWSRVDRVDWGNFEVIEIKPEHLRADGEREAAIYAQEMDRFHNLGPGRKWKSRCVTYDQTRAVGYLVEIGYFTRASVGMHGLYSWRAEAYMYNQVPARAAKPPTAPPVPQVSSDAGLEALYAYMRPRTPASTPAPAGPQSGAAGAEGDLRASTGTWQPAPHVVIGAPDPYGTAKGDALQAGLDMGIAAYRKWYENRQRELEQEQRRKLQPEIDRMRNEHPELGVLLIVRKRTAGDTEGKLPPRFVTLRVAYGRSALEAERRLGAIATAGGPIQQQDFEASREWTPPLKPTEAPVPAPPFPPVALATFKSSSPKLTEVTLGVTPFGFNDVTTTPLDVPPGFEPRFYVLSLPTTIKVFGGGEYHEGPLDQEQHGDLPVAQLDVFVPGHDVVAALYPADSATADLFATAPPTTNWQRLDARNFGLVRWADPEELTLLRTNDVWELLER